MRSPRGKEPKKGVHPTPAFRHQRPNRAVLFFSRLQSLALLDASLPTCLGKSQLRLEAEGEALCQSARAHCLRGGPDVVAQGGGGGEREGPHLS